MESASHVGNVLERNNSFAADIRIKRGSFISRVHSILQEMSFAKPNGCNEEVCMPPASMVPLFGTCLMGNATGYTLHGTMLLETHLVSQESHLDILWRKSVNTYTFRLCCLQGS